MTALPDYAAALAIALDGVEPLAGIETVPLEDAAGRVLAEPIAADRDLPPFDRAQMDGYALRSREWTPHQAWSVSADVPAGAPGPDEVPAGACVSIATGARIPADLDTVIQHERSDRGSPVRFTVESIAPGHAVHPRGADARAGDVLIERGALIGAAHVGVAATVGRDALVVRRRPRAWLVTSGDEVVEPSSDVQPWQIRNSNRPMLRAQLDRIGVEVVRALHLPDERGETERVIGAALGEADLVITVGGVSAGVRDHFPAAFEAHGVRPALRHAGIQPGKPIYVGRRGPAIVIGLPGNPVSVLACSCLFLWPIARVLAGLDAALPWRDSVLARDVNPNPRRRAFRPATLDGDGRATVPTWAGSGDLAHTVPTHGLVELPVQSDTVHEGTTIRFLPWP